MITVILNWNQGENDPFTVASQSMAEIFYRSGKVVATLEITDPNWAEKLGHWLNQGIDFVFTWQGLASQARVGPHDELIWDIAQVPLVCLHGDHPAYMPDNHLLDRPYCFHLYTNSDFARYANTHFRRLKAASVVDVPRLYFEKPLVNNGDKSFYIVKNITHTDALEQEWKQNIPDVAYQAYMQAAEVLKLLIHQSAYVEMHEVLDAMIVTEQWDWLNEAQNPGLLHHYHRSLDYYVRSYKSMCLLNELTQIPLKIFGRGWECFQAQAPKCWSFHEGLDMAQSQQLFYSEYGIIDISPSKRLHDRTRRAMANGQSFLSSANLEDSFDSIAGFENLFFDFRTGQLEQRCEVVLQSPTHHRERSQAFANRYHETFHYRDFVERIDGLAHSFVRQK
jgi:hypothetical protein